MINPQDVIAPISRALAPQGQFICSVPNVVNESRDVDGLPKNRYHKQLFSFNSLSRLLEKNGLTVTYRVGQSWANTLSRREYQLYRNKKIDKLLGDLAELRNPEMLRYFAYLLGYPTPEDVDGSYAIIVVAQKD